MTMAKLKMVDLLQTNHISQVKANQGPRNNLLEIGYHQDKTKREGAVEECVTHRVNFTIKYQM